MPLHSEFQQKLNQQSQEIREQVLPDQQKTPKEHPQDTLVVTNILDDAAAFILTYAPGRILFDCCRFNSNSGVSRTIATNSNTTVTLRDTQTSVEPIVTGSGTVQKYNGGVDVQGDIVSHTNLVMPTPTVPASSTDAGQTGQVAWDGEYIYICIGTNQWHRVAHTTW